MAYLAYGWPLFHPRTLHMASRALPGMIHEPRARSKPSKQVDELWKNKQTKSKCIASHLKYLKGCASRVLTIISPLCFCTAMNAHWYFWTPAHLSHFCWFWWSYLKYPHNYPLFERDYQICICMYTEIEFKGMKI